MGLEEGVNDDGTLRQKRGVSTWHNAFEEERKRILEKLMEEARVEKPGITKNELEGFIRAKYPGWSKSKVADYGETLYWMIASFLKKKMKEETEVKQSEQTKTS